MEYPNTPEDVATGISISGDNWERERWKYDGPAVDVVRSYYNNEISAEEAIETIANMDKWVVDDDVYAVDDIERKMAGAIRQYDNTFPAGQRVKGKHVMDIFRVLFRAGLWSITNLQQ